MYWNETKECMSRDQIEELQSKRLVKQINRIYHNVEYYRKKMQEAGLEPSDIRGIEDLDKLPFTTYEDIAKAYPLAFLQYHSLRQSEYMRQAVQQASQRLPSTQGRILISGQSALQDASQWLESLRMT